MAQLLSDSEIQEKAAQLEGWEVEGKELKRTMEFKDFVTAIDFVNKLVEPAEAAGHHPDLAISYNKVTVALTSHDAGGLTEKDFEMAQVLSNLNKTSN
jgi:4a-hydroxytetrahydrobiopterin dehydratase